MPQWTILCAAAKTQCSPPPHKKGENTGPSLPAVPWHPYWRLVRPTGRDQAVPKCLSHRNGEMVNVSLLVGRFVIICYTAIGNIYNKIHSSWGRVNDYWRSVFGAISSLLLSQRFPLCVSNHNAYPHDSQKLKLSKLYLKEKIWPRQYH